MKMNNDCLAVNVPDNMVPKLDMRSMLNDPRSQRVKEKALFTRFCLLCVNIRMTTPQYLAIR